MGEAASQGLSGLAATLREAAPGDVPRLLGFIERYYTEDGYPFRETAARAALQDLIADKALGSVWVICVRGEPVGYAVLTLGYSLEYLGRDAFVDELYVEAGHRGRGLGRLALERIEQECRERGVRALHLEVEPDKQGALQLYRRLGFEDRGRRLMTKRM